MADLNWRGEFGRLALWLIIATFVGIYTDALAWCYGGVLFLSLVRAWRNLAALERWLNQISLSEPPELNGMWGQVVEKIYRQRKQDRQDRIRLRATISYFRDSVKSLPFAVVMVDTDGAIEWLNDAAMTLLGLRYPEDVGQQLVNLIRSPDFLQYYLSKNYSVPFLMISPFNAHVRLRLSVSEVGRGNRILFAQDYSREHQLEEVRKQFVSNASHELRTPLTVVNGYLETCYELPDVKDHPLLQRAFEQMLMQSQRMMALIEDLLVLSRLEVQSQTLKKDVVLLKPLLLSIADEAAMLATHQCSVWVDCDEQVNLVGDASELRSCITNLVNNAVKYGHSDGNVWVRWYADQDYGYLSVQDDGIGIDAVHLPHLTERFYRVDASRAQATGGTGLGLSIVKHILMRHNALLNIESELGKGSVFTCVFSKKNILINPINLD